MLRGRAIDSEEQQARKQTNERGEGNAMLETCSETRVKQDARENT